MYSTILLPTDGSEAARKAVPHARRLASAFDASVHVLYVVDTNATSLTLGAEQVDRLDTGQFGEMTELHREAADAIQGMREPIEQAGITVEPWIEAGVPHTVIARVAEECDADLVVMASHGRGGIKRALLGSVTERVARNTTIPTLIVDARQDVVETPVTA